MNKLKLFSGLFMLLLPVVVVLIYLASVSINIPKINISLGQAGLFVCGLLYFGTALYLSIKGALE